MKKKRLNILKKLFLIFFLFQIYGLSYAQESVPKFENLNKNYFFKNIFDSKIINKKSTYFYFARNQLNFSNVFSKIFDISNLIFFLNFSDKYEITYFLKTEDFKKSQKLFIYSPNILIKRPNLQNPKNNKFYLLEKIEKDLFISEIKDNYTKLNFDIYSNKKALDLFLNSNIYIFNEFCFFDSIKRLKDKKIILDNCEIKIENLNKKKIDFEKLYKVKKTPTPEEKLESIAMPDKKKEKVQLNEIIGDNFAYINISEFEKRNKNILFYIYFLLTFFIIFFLKNFSNIEKKINQVFYIKLILLLFIMNTFLESFSLTGEMVIEKFSFIVVYLIILFKQYENNFKKFKFLKFSIIGLFFGLIVFLILLDIQIYKTFLDIFSTIIILMILTFIIKKTYH